MAYSSMNSSVPLSIVAIIVSATLALLINKLNTAVLNSRAEAATKIFAMYKFTRAIMKNPSSPGLLYSSICVF